MIRYYREKDGGDYLAVNTALSRFEPGVGKIYEGRATAITSHLGSVCTTGISLVWLKHNCIPLRGEDVPEEWLKAIGLNH